MNGHLNTSLKDLEELARTSLSNSLFVAFGGTAYAVHFGDINTKDFDVLIVGADVAVWTRVIKPFFVRKGYQIFEHETFDRRRAIAEFGQSHVRRYGIVFYKTVRGPSGNDIDINFADSRLFEADIMKTAKWHEPLAGRAMRVITRNRLALDIVYDLHRGDQKVARARAMLQKLRDETVESLPPSAAKRISRALEARPVAIANGWRGTFGSATIPQLLLTGVSMATPWLEERGVHAVLKGGTVSTQYAETLETDDIDVQLYRVAPIRFTPLRPTTPADPKTDEKDWATYYDDGMFGAIIGFMIFVIQLLRTIDVRSLAAVLSEASGSRVTNVQFGLRISHPPRQTKHITLLSIDMFMTVAGGGVATHPLFDCVLGDIRNIPSETHFESSTGNGAFLKMHDSATVNANFVRMLENASPVKEEKRLKRLIEKKLRDNKKKTNVRNFVMRGAVPPAAILPHSISSQAWAQIRDEYVSSTNARSKTAIGHMLAVSENAGGNVVMTSPNSNNNYVDAMNVDANMTLENIIRTQARLLRRRN